MGIPDSQIILMLADDMACNSRNKFKAQIIASHSKKHGNIQIYDEDIEVDFRGEETNVENVLRLLTGRQSENTPLNQRLNTDENSNILFYITGHGGDLFLKFHDKEEIQSQDLSDAFQMMYKQKRYNEILFIADTCQAATLYKEFSSPNIIGIGSSDFGESSYSHRTNQDKLVGVSIIDRFTYYMLLFFEGGMIKRKSKLIDLFNSFNYKKLDAHHKWKTFNLKRNINDVKVTDFFSSVIDVYLIQNIIQLNNSIKIENSLINDKYKNEENVFEKFGIVYKSINDYGLDSVLIDGIFDVEYSKIIFTTFLGLIILLKLV